MISPKILRNTLPFPQVISKMPFLQWVSGEADSSVLKNPVFGSYGLVGRVWSDIFIDNEFQVEYYPGDVNLLISVPHGGEMKPPFIPDRVKKVDDKILE